MTYTVTPAPSGGPGIGYEHGHRRGNTRIGDRHALHHHGERAGFAATASRQLKIEPELSVLSPPRPIRRHRGQPAGRLAPWLSGPVSMLTSPALPRLSLRPVRNDCRVPTAASAPVVCRDSDQRELRADRDGVHPSNRRTCSATQTFDAHVGDSLSTSPLTGYGFSSQPSYTVTPAASRSLAGCGDRVVSGPHSRGSTDDIHDHGAVGRFSATSALTSRRCPHAGTSRRTRESGVALSSAPIGPPASRPR